MVKRDKRSRLRGTRSCGRGARKKGRGSGQRGGVGMAGSGKKSSQKLVFLKKYFPNYLGRRGFKSINQKKGKKLRGINLKEIERKLKKFEKKGLLKDNNLNLKKYKILGNGELKEKLIISAGSFSQSAREKIEAAGGKAVENVIKK